MSAPAVLDACVLYPTILREVLVGVAARGAFVPVWSQRLLDEWTHAAARLGPEGAQVARVEALLLAEAFPAARVEGRVAVDHLHLPDDADRHVIETALAAGARTIVTLNLRDFPGRVLAGLGLAAVHPDAFLLALHGAAPEAVEASLAAAEARAAAAGGALSRAALLKRAGLPRLARALRV